MGFEPATLYHKGLHTAATLLTYCICSEYFVVKCKRMAPEEFTQLMFCFSHSLIASLITEHFNN
jgi:hypothetical protein